jgi:hypothetical protein
MVNPDIGLDCGTFTTNCVVVTIGIFVGWVLLFHVSSGLLSQPVGQENGLFAGLFCHEFAPFLGALGFGLRAAPGEGCCQEWASLLQRCLCGVVIDTSTARSVSPGDHDIAAFYAAHHRV